MGKPELSLMRQGCAFKGFIIASQLNATGKNRVRIIIGFEYNRARFSKPFSEEIPRSLARLVLRLSNDRQRKLLPVFIMGSMDTVTYSKGLHSIANKLIFAKQHLILQSRINLLTLPQIDLSHRPTTRVKRMLKNRQATREKTGISCQALWKIVGT